MGKQQSVTVVTTDAQLVRDILARLGDPSVIAGSAEGHIHDGDFVARTAAERARLRDGIRAAIAHANGRASEWGERAEACFAFLRAALEEEAPDGQME